jgi:hypothetical protein
MNLNLPFFVDFVCLYYYLLYSASSGFYCTPVLQQVYIGVTCLIFLIGMVVSVFGATKSPNAALIRQGGFASLTIFGFVPLCRKCSVYIILLIYIICCLLRNVLLCCVVLCCVVLFCVL